MKKILVRIFVILAVTVIVFFLIKKMIVIHKNKNRPNIILISIETTRADHLHCYGYFRETSPTIDKIAKEGLLCEKMFTSRGQTWPALTSLMTSLYPVQHGVRKNGHALDAKITSLAQILNKNGYTCGAFLSNALEAKWRGFDIKVDGQKKDLENTKKAISWLKENANKRHFLWVHYWQPHRPYQPPKPYDKKFNPAYTGEMNGDKKQLDKIALEKIDISDSDLNHIISLYDGSILYADYLISHIMGALTELNLKEDSLIIITSDHGEDLYQHHHYFYHSASIYESSLHIPFIIKYPGKIEPGKKIKNIVEIIDIAPTILDYLDIKVPENFEGTSMKNLFEGSSTDNFEYAFSEWQDKILSIRTDKFRYIYNPKNYHPIEIKGATSDTYPIEREGLYNLIDDPFETKNLVSLQSNRTETIKNELFNWKHFKIWKSGYNSPASKEIPEDVKKKLRSLGYL